MWTCLFSRLLEWRGNLLSTLLIVVGGHRSSTFVAEKQQENLENGIYIPNKIDAIFSYIFTLASLVATELLLPPKTQCSPWFWVEQGGKIWFVSSRLLVGHPGTEMENVLKTQRDILIPTQKKLDHAALDKFGARNKRLIFLAWYTKRRWVLQEFYQSTMLKTAFYTCV